MSAETAADRARQIVQAADATTGLPYLGGPVRVRARLVWMARALLAEMEAHEVTRRERDEARAEAARLRRMLAVERGNAPRLDPEHAADLETERRVVNSRGA